MRAAVVPLLLAAAATASSDPWDRVRTIFADAVANNATPGLTAIVGGQSGVLFQAAVGDYTYGKTPPASPNRKVKLSTIYDMASLTKVVSTTSAAALLYQRGYLSLHEPISSDKLLGPNYAGQGKASVTVLNCLLHNAGFPPDPSPNYWADDACPGIPLPSELSFNCSDHIYKRVLSQTLDRPVGASYVYSDLSMITLMFAVGRVVIDNSLVSTEDLIPRCRNKQLGEGARMQCAYEAFVRTQVFEPLGMNDTGFLPMGDRRGLCAPTGVPAIENVSTILQGRVEDGNAFNLGGISGHAGVFSTAPDVAKLMNMYMFARGSAGDLLSADTKALFTREYNHSQSSRALGWNTNDPAVPDEGWDLTCGNLSAKTYMHIGYTGTMICADPERNIFTILLTNRVYPTSKNPKIGQVRRDFNNAVVDILDGRV